MRYLQLRALTRDEDECLPNISRPSLGHCGSIGSRPIVVITTGNIAVDWKAVVQDDHGNRSTGSLDFLWNHEGETPPKACRPRRPGHWGDPASAMGHGRQRTHRWSSASDDTEACWQRLARTRGRSADRLRRLRNGRAQEQLLAPSQLLDTSEATDAREGLVELSNSQVRDGAQAPQPTQISSCIASCSAALRMKARRLRRVSRSTGQGSPWATATLDICDPARRRLKWTVPGAGLCANPPANVTRFQCQSSCP